jgi:hypothetical protein
MYTDNRTHQHKYICFCILSNNDSLRISIITILNSAFLNCELYFLNCELYLVVEPPLFFASSFHSCITGLGVFMCMRVSSACMCVWVYLFMGALFIYVCMCVHVYIPADFSCLLRTATLRRRCCSRVPLLLGAPLEVLIIVTSAYIAFGCTTRGATVTIHTHHITFTIPFLVPPGPLGARVEILIRFASVYIAFSRSRSRSALSDLFIDHMRAYVTRSTKHRNYA